MSFPPIVTVTIVVSAVTEPIWLAIRLDGRRARAGDERQRRARALLGDEPRIRVDAAATRARQRVAARPDS